MPFILGFVYYFTFIAIIAVVTLFTGNPPIQ